MEDLKNIINLKTKIRTYNDKVYSNFHGLNMLEDDAEYESFAILSIDCILLTTKNATFKYI